MEQLVGNPKSTSSLFDEALPDALLPFRHSFSPNFFKVRRELARLHQEISLHPAEEPHLEQPPVPRHGNIISLVSSGRAAGGSSESALCKHIAIADS